MTFTRWRALAAALLLGLSALFTSGCVAALFGVGVVAGAGTVAYVKGELKSIEDVPYQRLRQAAEETLAMDFGLTLDKIDTSVGETYMAFRDSSGTRTSVTLLMTSGTATELRIRVGTFGNQAKSQLVYDAIKRRVGTP